MHSILFSQISTTNAMRSLYSFPVFIVICELYNRFIIGPCNLKVMQV